jgi:uncharacterized protein
VTEPRGVFERYVWAGMTRNADALAELFTDDGVYEAPLMPEGRQFPRRLAGREAIRAGMAEYYRLTADDERAVDIGRSRYVLHTTADPDVFVVEVDTVFLGEHQPMSLVYIFRTRDGKIALLRDYFAPDRVS